MANMLMLILNLCLLDCGYVYVGQVHNGNCDGDDDYGAVESVTLNMILTVFLCGYVDDARFDNDYDCGYGQDED